jgi:hypothetical protein
MAEIEDQLKLQNWLGIVTFDVFKYQKAGGQVVVEQTEDGLRFTLLGIDINNEGVNRQFRRAIEELAPTASPADAA